MGIISFNTSVHIKACEKRFVVIKRFFDQKRELTILLLLNLKFELQIEAGWED